jgi:hypothetical protein
MQLTSFKTEMEAGLVCMYVCMYVYICVCVCVNEPFGSAKRGAFLSQKHVISSQERLHSVFRRAKHRNFF